MDLLADGRTLFLLGTFVTLKVFFWSALLATGCALLAGMGRVSNVRLVSSLAVAYIEFFRGTSVVVQLFWLYFALPFFGIALSAFQASVVGLGLCFGAYGAEAVRGAIMAIPRSQTEACTALNLTSIQKVIYVILPQAILIILPAYGNVLIMLLKGTATASMITVPELTFQAYSLNVRTFQTIPIFGAVLVIYFFLALVLSTTIRVLERLLGTWRHRRVHSL
jgi:polar amino acid transport system permease protein